MGREINQKSHDTAIFNIIVLLRKEHHTLLRHNESTRRERRKTTSREKEFHKNKNPGNRNTYLTKEKQNHHHHHHFLWDCFKRGEDHCYIHSCLGKYYFEENLEKIWVIILITLLRIQKWVNAATPTSTSQRRESWRCLLEVWDRATT